MLGAWPEAITGTELEGVRIFEIHLGTDVDGFMSSIRDCGASPPYLISFATLALVRRFGIRMGWSALLPLRQVGPFPPPRLSPAPPLRWPGLPTGLGGHPLVLPKRLWRASLLPFWRGMCISLLAHWPSRGAPGQGAFARVNLLRRRPLAMDVQYMQRPRLRLRTCTCLTMSWRRGPRAR